MIAYFSMEIALDPAMPTYSGGLGILAGDTIRSAADLRIPLVAVSLLHRKGYFRQELASDGSQHEFPVDWPVSRQCKELPERIEVTIEGRTVRVRAWQYLVKGVSGHDIPVLLLDTDLAENTEWDRALTDHLYGGDAHYRLCQEVVLGIGGVRMLRALGHHEIDRFHLNEGHAALLALELLDERARWFNRAEFLHEDVEAVRRRCVFTTHTPVPAGHDRYPLDHVGRVLGRRDIFEMHEVFCCDGELNLTYLALNLSHYVNGVARRHGEVAQSMLTPRDSRHRYRIDHITNGVHLATWVSPPFVAVFDDHIPGWREDNSSLRGVLGVPSSEIWQAHVAAKRQLVDAVNQQTNAGFDLEVLTLGFARRFATYKRPTLLLRDPTRLKAISAGTGRIQVVYAGKAHPQDEAGKELIREVFRARAQLEPEVKVAFLQDYNWETARLLVAGCDVWLNTPEPPNEASGTSGMKAALNGVPSLSVADGWWLEGCIENLTGWTVEDAAAGGSASSRNESADPTSLLDQLEQVVVPQFYSGRGQFLRIMQHAIALNASHFNTQRMLQEYIAKAYLN